MQAANQPRGEPPPLELEQRVVARDALVLRLCDVVSWPETRVPAHERHLAADILVGLLRTTSLELRQRCAQGLVRVTDAPKALLRYLARDEIGVALPLLEAGVGFDDSDLVSVVRGGVASHWLAITRRRSLNETVTDALIQTGDAAVIEAVLRNRGARLSMQGVDLAVARSRQAAELSAPLVQRQELRPAQALTLFWWTGFEQRVQILRRFSVDRAVLIEELSEVFKLAAAEGWADADTRKALQVIERRQRNRAAAARSAYGSLEGAVAAAANDIDRTLLREIAHLSGIKPTTAVQVFSDAGGEAIGVFCKAVGLKKPSLLALWRALRRPAGDIDSTSNALGRAVYVFDTLATAKAQSVLRYWNWSFTADAVDIHEVNFEQETHDVPIARRNAALLFGRNG